MVDLIQFAQQQGKLTRGEKGACAPYLWYVMEISYLCRLRGIETVTLTDANETPEGVLTNRRKGSRDNIVRWTPRLQAAWEAAKQVRATIWAKKKMPIPTLPGITPDTSTSIDAKKLGSISSRWRMTTACRI
ncbi:hypothetical protein FQZ97_1111950 [compost metagenome]